MKKIVCQSISARTTQSFGRTLARNLTAGGTILLHGELGAGKTTFVQGLADGLGIQQHITSPTFTLMAVYENLTHPTIQRLVHLDLYRINEVKDLLSLDVDTWQNDRDTLVVVEWAERALQVWKNILGEITLTTGTNSSHRTLTAFGLPLE